MNEKIKKATGGVLYLCESTWIIPARLIRRGPRHDEIGEDTYYFIEINGKEIEIGRNLSFGDTNIDDIVDWKSIKEDVENDK